VSERQREERASVGCRVQRWRMSAALDGGGGLAAGLERHVEGCPSCREYWQRVRRLDGFLRPERAEAVRPATVEMKIVRLRRRQFWQRLGGAAAMICAAAALLAALAGPWSGGRGEIDGLVATPVETVAEVSVAEISWGSIVGLGRDEMRAMVSELATEPLEAELALLTSGALRVARSLPGHLPVRVSDMLEAVD
jgi:predicted anti-sigma-YlaC factor YlaD